MYLPVKALHIVFVVAWFAGLFYIVRLFVYLRETQDRPESERAVLEPQLRMMANRLWFGITWPAGLAALLFGMTLLQYFWPPPLWLQLKLGLVAGLIGYHLGCHWIHARLQRGERVWTSRAFRMWNELATLFLVAIVFLVVMKDAMSLVYGVVGLLLFTGVLMLGITGYRRWRERSAAR